MIVKCVWEHNGDDTLLYALDFVGAYTRGENLELAMKKMKSEIQSYIRWGRNSPPEEVEVMLIEEKSSALNVKDADSDVIFERERLPLSLDEYNRLKTLALKSAKDFLLLYDCIPDKDCKLSSARKTFYGEAPRSANEMYEHTKSVNEYYFAEIGIRADNNGDIYECRKRGFDSLESKFDFLENTVFEGSYGEDWSLRKMLRRFIWHDRIHAKALYRRASKVFGAENIINPFCF